MWFIVSYLSDGINCRKHFTSLDDAMRFCRAHNGTLAGASL